MEVSQVNKRVKSAIEQARARARARREATASAEQAYAQFLETIATPVARQVVNALKVAGIGFTVGTPGGGLRLSADRGRDDYIELALDTSGDVPQAVGRVRVTRGSRTLEQTEPLRAGVGPEALTEDDVLDFLLRALEPWLER